MSRLSHSGYLILTAALIFAGVHLCEGSLHAQAGEGQAVNIVTVDGVKLKGFFYAGKATAPTCILLHPIGEGKSSKSQDWKGLAEALQKGGYSVMLFDFRGHGESTVIDQPDAFWAVAANRLNIKTKSKDELDVKDFINANAYLPVLVNDIAAVKAYLDRLHDKGTCNTSNTIVIGADNGGTLGAIWINSEWNRYRLTPPTKMGMQPTVSKRAEGKDIIAAVFLSITSDLGPKRKVSVPNILTNACKTNGMGATFFFGDKDVKAKEFAKTLESKLIVKDKDGKPSKKHTYIGGVEIANTNLSGVKLLQKGLKTDVSILEYLDGIVAERTNEYVERDVQNALYLWRVPTSLQPIPSKNKKGERNLLFNDYSAYAQ